MLKTKTFLIALAALLVLPAGAGAATTLGLADPNPNPSGSQAINWSSDPTLFTAAAPAGVQLAAPFDGVITGWTIYTHDTFAGSSVQLRKLTPVSGKEKDFILDPAAGAIEPLGDRKATKDEYHDLGHTYSAQLPITAGQIVGATVRKGAGSAMLPVLPYEEGSAWAYGCLNGGCAVATDGVAATANVFKTQWLALNATLEPDLNHNGYGDETQEPPAPPPLVQTQVQPPKKKKCPKGKKRSKKGKKKGKCVKKHKKKHRGANK